MRMFDALVSAIGDEAAEKLIGEFGGSRLYVRVAPGLDSRLAKQIGLKAALSLARVFGGEYIDVPRPRVRSEMGERILALYRKGRALNDIAREAGCSRSLVLYHLRRPRLIANLH